MQLKLGRLVRNLTLAFLVMNLLLAAAWARTEIVLHSFTGNPDGALPDAGVAFDAKGNMYGTTREGGSSNGGTVFRVTPAGKEIVLYSFGGSKGAAVEPRGGVVLDAIGNMYGTTVAGGASRMGTVFKVTPSGKGSILYSFEGGTDGGSPLGGLALDPKPGNLYGTTKYGGAFGNGTVFKVTRSGKETVLYSFTGGTDGTNPESGVILDAKGNVYGTTDLGTDLVFKVTPSGKETVLYAFKDAEFPEGRLVFDAKDNLYGTTAAGGAFGPGAVFKVTPSGKETVLYSFKGGKDGSGPYAGLVFDGKGSLYGTTSGEGDSENGTVFQLTPSHKEIVLYRFKGGTDGATPVAGLVFDLKGNLYGTTYYGGGSSNCGSGGCGTVFKLVP
jgi:uncharacterized repeat protein (TIGR03803 family)